VEDFLDHTTDITMTFAVVELAESCRIFVKASMSCEDGASSLPTRFKSLVAVKEKIVKEDSDVFRGWQGRVEDNQPNE
jgi:hypothetical protein